MANRYMKRCSISLVIRKMEIKTTVRYYLKSIKLSSKDLQMANVDRMWRKGSPCMPLVQPLCKTIWRFLKKLQIEALCHPAVGHLFSFEYLSEEIAAI